MGLKVRSICMIALFDRGSERVRGHLLLIFRLGVWDVLII